MLRRLSKVFPAAIAGLLVATLLTPAYGERRRAPRTGRLDIVSTTLGAQVFVDGERVGEIPLEEAMDLPVGEHTVKVSKRGYTQHHEVVRIKRRQTTTVEADLLALSGVLRVACNVPEANVFVDDDFVGQAPTESEVDPGPRAVRVSMQGYRDFEQSVEIVAGEETELAVELERLPPPEIIPPAPEDPRWFERWWVWTIIGAAVVAVAVSVPVAILTADRNPCEDAGWNDCTTDVQIFGENW